MTIFLWLILHGSPMASNSFSNYIESNDVSKFSSNKKIVIDFTTIFLNIRSLINYKNFTIFENWINSLNFFPEVIAINETWEKPHNSGQFKNLPIYTYISNCRPMQSGGGVALYIKYSLTFSLRSDLTIMQEGIFDELVFIEIQLYETKITCGTIYRPLKQDESSKISFMNHLKNLLSVISKSKKNLHLWRFQLQLIRAVPQAYRQFC